MLKHLNFRGNFGRIFPRRIRHPAMGSKKTPTNWLRATMCSDFFHHPKPCVFLQKMFQNNMIEMIFLCGPFINECFCSELQEWCWNPYWLLLPTQDHWWTTIREKPFAEVNENFQLSRQYWAHLAETLGELGVAWARCPGFLWVSGPFLRGRGATFVLNVGDVFPNQKKTDTVAARKEGSFEKRGWLEDGFFEQKPFELGWIRKWFFFLVYLFFGGIWGLPS